MSERVRPSTGTVIGSGGGVISLFLQTSFSQLKLQTVELDPEVIKVAKDFFFFDSPVIEADGYEFSAEGKYPSRLYHSRRVWQPGRNRV